MVDILFAVLGTAMVIVWFFFAAKGIKRYAAYVSVLDGQEYFLKELFGIGYYVIEKFQVELHGGHFRKRQERLTELRGKNNALFYVRADLAAQITYVLTILPFGFLIAVCAQEEAILFIAVLIAVVLVIYVEYDENSRLEKRHQSIKRDFPHVLSQLSLLVNAGRPLREAIKVASNRGEGMFYEELRLLLEDMKNGIPEYEALQKFAERCGIPEVRKFSSIIIQNVKKGSSELAYAMLELSREVWRERVNSVREEGEKASAKLLFPIFIIFGGILLMVVVPILKNMNI